MKKIFFLSLFICLNQDCFANFISEYFSALKNNRLVFATGCITGALTVGCLWYYKTYSVNTVNKCLDKAPSQNATSQSNNKDNHSRKKIVPWFFYPKGCIDEIAEQLFIELLKKDSYYVQNFNLQHMPANAYINTDDKNRAAPLIFIRNQGRYGDTIAFLNKQITSVKPIYVLVHSPMTKKEYNEITSQYNADVISFACICKLNSTTKIWDYILPDDKYNQTARERLFQKIHQSI